MKKVLLYMALIVVATPIAVFAVDSMTGDHSIKYDNDGTWLCHHPIGSNMSSCWMIAPFIPASYLKEPSQLGYIRFKKWSEINICNGGAGILRVAGKANPSLMIECE